MPGGALILGGAELRTGAWMVRGTIVSLTEIPRLPTFSYSCAYHPTFLRLCATHLQAQGFPIPDETSGGAYLLYAGDAAVSRKGEIHRLATARLLIHRRAGRVDHGYILSWASQW